MMRCTFTTEARGRGPLRRSVWTGTGLLPACLIALVIACTGAAEAATFRFAGIGQGSDTNVAILEDQLRVTLSDGGAAAGGAGQVIFRFENHGDEQATLTRFHIDDRMGYLDYFVATAPVGTGGGTSFVAAPAHPGPTHLTGGQHIGFETSLRMVEGGEVAFSAGANSPAHRHGLEPGGALEVPILLADGVTPEQVIAAMGSEIDLGIFVTRFRRGGGVSATLFIPEPGSAGLLAAGLLALAGLRRSARRGTA